MHWSCGMRASGEHQKGFISLLSELRLIVNHHHEAGSAGRYVFPNLPKAGISIMRPPSPYLIYETHRLPSTLRLAALLATLNLASTMCDVVPTTYLQWKKDCLLFRRKFRLLRSRSLTSVLDDRWAWFGEHYSIGCI